jgi:IS5 family transposase
VVQVAEVTANTRRGARGYVLPTASAPGNPGENRLLDQTAAEWTDSALPRVRSPSTAGSCPARPGRPWPGWRRRGRLSPVGRARVPTYPQAPGPLPYWLRGRISHLKRGYHLRRSRLKGDQEQRIWTGWAILAYNLDTLAIQTT